MLKISGSEYQVINEKEPRMQMSGRPALVQYRAALSQDEANTLRHLIKESGLSAAGVFRKFLQDQKRKLGK